MILEDIAAKKRRRLEVEKRRLSTEALRELAMNSGGTRGLFREAIKRPGLSVIAEVKKASPSKGLICGDFEPVRIAREYEAAGAAAVSVLTEEDFFLGKAEYLLEVKENTKIPVLRKDFILDPWQVYESRLMGADAILLIAALLPADRLKELRALTEELAMDVLAEAHNAEELARCIGSGADIVGINNRDLHTFAVDLRTTGALRGLIPPHIAVVSESGVDTAEDMRYLRDLAVDAVLIGESLMRAPSVWEKMRELTRTADG
jgi:indole-3-glycerol phosphate synthase